MKRIKNDVRKKVVLEYKNGLSNVRISNMFNISESSVRRILRESHCEPSKNLGEGQRCSVMLKKDMLSESLLC